MVNLKIKLLILFLSLVCLSLSGTTYYVSPGGKDSNAGSLSQPFFTLNKAWTVVAAGDIIYVRGGTYSYTSQQRLTGKNGTAANLIKIWAYPGETPVITRAGTWSWRDFMAGIYFTGNYCHFKGLKITGFNQKDTNVWTAMRCEDFNNCIFEAMDFSWSGLGSYMTGNCDGNLLLNCDWHDNYDPLTSYENADGLNFENVTEGGVNTVRGCRFWNNSDDGLDIYNNNSYLSIENCWAWGQGFKEDQITVNGSGDGNGFKLGPTNISAPSTVLRRIVNCISYGNASWGFNENEAICNMEVYNNITYKNSDANSWGGGYHLNSSGVAYYIKNNISYLDVPKDADLLILTNTNHNSWNGAVKVTNTDFVSLDATELARQRKSDGSLPDINFLHLAAGSDLIDAGTDVGLPFNGKAPDLGAFEFQSGLPAPLPVYLSSVVENATPSLLEISFDLNLNNLVIPATSTFNVSVNTLNRTVKSVAISGNKVRLTLASDIVYGDLVTVSYTKPATNPIVTVSGGEAASFSNNSVTNNCKAPDKPVSPPVAVVKNQETVYSGFVYEIDASGSFDPNNDLLTYEWTIPSIISVSSRNSSKIRYLAPIVLTSKNIEFQVNVKNGINSVSQTIIVNVLPYKPELEIAKTKTILASSYQSPDYPYNVTDVNLSTKWSANGDNSWLTLPLSVPFKVSHVMLAFLQGQHYSSYFDIHASKDNVVWDTILIGVHSCDFSGDMQVFDFPSGYSNNEYSYIKYIGHGNSLNLLNIISEFNVHGTPMEIPVVENNHNNNITIYPNPAVDHFNISLNDSALKPDKISIINFSGKIVYQGVLNPENTNIQVSMNFKSGIYIVELGMGDLILFAQKLIIN